jgi:ABC-type bacteriocin/lantibiotic exporter with double-glycine peptidase domain
VGLVTQQNLLWNATILENLTYPGENISDGEIEEVLGVAALREVVDGHPRCIHTNISDDGCRLSEGQKQRLAIARCLLRKPGLLILDEALSFADNRTAPRVVSGIRRARPGTSILIASHNPRILQFTDRVVLMKSAGASEKEFPPASSASGLDRQAAPVT